MSITMADHRRFIPHFNVTAIAAAALVAAGSAAAQTALPRVTVTGPAPVASIGGWGDVPLAKVPYQATLITGETMQNNGIQRLADIVKIDPAVSDSYNAEGYWDYLTVRGYVIDNRFNYRRDGLPISAETILPLNNKESIEVLKGTSGLQAGTSAPGGLVNLVVKRPTNDEPLRNIRLGWKENGSVGAAVDLSQRFGVDNAFGVRINASHEALDPKVHETHGQSTQFAIAADWRIGSGTLIEVEAENSHRRQRSVPGMSMQGNNVPAPRDPRINLNNQPWSEPVVMDGNTASVRVTQKLSDDWKVTAHGGTQRLRTDDRLAYPFGCTDANGLDYYGDRFCPDGTYDMYDFRSDNERRRTDALELAAHGKFDTFGLAHAVSFGGLRSRVDNRFQGQAYNFAGTGNVDGTAIGVADPTPSGNNTNRDEDSNELFLRDALKLSSRLTAWLGVRHTRLHRRSIQTDGSEPIDYAQSFTTPSVALSFDLMPQLTTYASWGQGIESDVAPARDTFTNRGQALPALKSDQVEIGAKWTSDTLSGGVALFDIDRPQARAIGANCGTGAPNTCTYQTDGKAHHQGIEVNTAWRNGAFTLQGGIQYLHAVNEGSVNASINGKRPTNVPARTAKVEARYELLPGLTMQTNLLAESNRMVLEDNSVRIPGYGRVDAGLRYVTNYNAATYIWRVGVDNLFDKRAWKESPYQYDHVYLFPLAPRTFRASVEVSL
jgi:iron complex outermembrane receptor protein